VTTASLVVAVGAFAAILFGTLRILAGPRRADRIVAFDLLFSAGVASCIAAALATGRSELLDVAIGLSLVGFVGTIGWSRVVERAPRDPASPTSGYRGERRS
jgi:multicomponent Na+:H+ antiporter subunit F